MASLIEFHKWAGDRLSKPGPKKWDGDESNVKLYRQYLETVLNMPCSDNGIWSHWGANAHRVELRWNQEDWERGHPKKKPKVITLNQWLKDNHPEILQAYKERKV